MQLSAALLSSLLLLVLVALSALQAEARHHRHHKRALVEDYEYRDVTDYVSSDGVFVDSVPMKTTLEPKHLKDHQKTNRFPKLRRFFADGSDRFFH